MKNHILFLVTAALLFTGCAAPKFLSAPTIQYPPFPDQTKTVEDPGKARIYLIRKEKFIAAAASIRFFGSHSEVATGPQVGSSGRMHLIGEVGPGSYLCWEESPNPFVFDKFDGTTNTVATLNLEAGHVYYLRAYVHNGWMTASARVTVLNEKDGQAMLKDCLPPDDYRKAK